jgi:hypothetical protein
MVGRNITRLAGVIFSPPQILHPRNITLAAV